MTTPKPGWQQDPVPANARPRCTHIGQVFAALSIFRHPEGHTWVCTCGKVFVVVSNGGKNKRLVPKNGRP